MKRIPAACNSRGARAHLRVVSAVHIKPHAEEEDVSMWGFQGCNSAVLKAMVELAMRVRGVVVWLARPAAPRRAATTRRHHAP